MNVKDLIVKPISSTSARKICKLYHYSGTCVNNSCLHFGVFVGDVCAGVMQFGPPMVKAKVLPLVSGTGWNGMLELNRMAFGPLLPRNSESRALSVALRLIKKTYPHVEWILSFADGTQCGDGTIYRATGFVLTQIKKNNSIIKLTDGTITTNMTMGKGKHALKQGGRSGAPEGAVKLEGFQLRYIYFLNKEARGRLTVPEIPFSKIAELGAAMYKGKKRVVGVESGTSGFQPEGGGESPTTTLHIKQGV